MALELQLAHCETCKGYYCSTVLNPRDLDHPEIIDHYFYHGEPWFTMDKKTFDHEVGHQDGNVCIVDFDEHIKDDHSYCICAGKVKSGKKDPYHLTAGLKTKKKVVKDYIDQDIYFYDLYITYNNFHKDIPTRQAI